MMRGSVEKRDIGPRTSRVFVIGLVDDDGNPFREFREKLINLLPVRQSASRIIRVADINESGLGINRSEHGFQIVPMVTTQGHGADSCADGHGVAIDQFESWSGQDQPTTAAEKNIHGRLHDRGRSCPEEYLFSSNAVGASERRSEDIARTRESVDRMRVF